jgi:hypothetical protein
MNNWTYPDTTGWNEFPFEANGNTYVSKVKPDGSIGLRLQFVPNDVFVSMNKSAVLDLIGDGLTRAEILERLAEVNLNAYEAVIELA